VGRGSSRVCLGSRYGAGMVVAFGHGGAGGARTSLDRLEVVRSLCWEAVGVRQVPIPHATANCRWRSKRNGIIGCSASSVGGVGWGGARHVLARVSIPHIVIPMAGIPHMPTHTVAPGHTTNPEHLAAQLSQCGWGRDERERKRASWPVDRSSNRQRLLVPDLFDWKVLAPRRQHCVLCAHVRCVCAHGMCDGAQGTDVCWPHCRAHYEARGKAER
jgi:hypothetical protein